MDCYLSLAFAFRKGQIILSLFYIIVVRLPWPVAKHHTALSHDPTPPTGWGRE